MSRKILIVDDEEIERISMRKILSESFEHLILEEAGNGLEAVKTADTFKPDLILMDIKMPGMNGLEAVREITKTRPEIKFVMVTAHETFEFAREALKLGVDDYLLKPSKISEIVMTVRKVMNELDVEQAAQLEDTRKEVQYEQAKRILETDLVTQLLYDHVHDIHIDTLMNMLGIESTKEMFVIVFQLPDPSVKEYADYAGEFRKAGGVWVGALSSRLLPLIVFRNDKVSYRAQVSGLVRSGLSRKKTNQMTNWSAGVGSICQSLEQIRHSYQEALIAMMNVSRSGSYLFYEDVDTGHSKGDVRLEAYKKGEFFDHVKLGNWSALSHHLMMLISCYENEGVAYDLMKQAIMEVIWLMSRLVEEMENGLKLNKFKPKAGNYSHFREELDHYLTSVKNSYDKSAERDEQDSIQLIKRYIKKHSSETISLDTLSETVGLSPIYISKLFKEKLQINYIDFLTLCRIDHAKKIMVDPEKSIKEIALEVGYHDPNYFSKVFKKNMGMSPKTYKEKILRPSKLEQHMENGSMDYAT